MEVICMFSRDISIVLLLCPSLFTFTFIVTAILHIFKLGKSKKRIKKESKTIPVFEKLTLKGYVDRCEHHKKIATRIRKFFGVYLLALMGGIIVCLLSFFLVFLKYIANCYGFIKFLSLDVPFVLYSIFNTKNNRKHGGVTWKWKTE